MATKREATTEARSESRSASLLIRLSPEDQKAVKKLAQDRGVPVNSLVLEALGIDPTAGK
jgi:predicted DNA binding CopG/RHH family protein